MNQPEEKNIYMNARRFERYPAEAENPDAYLRHFRTTAENAANHIVITDTDGVVLYCNKSACEMTGYSKKETVGKKAGSLWGRQMGADFYEKLWRTIKINKKAFTGEITNRRKNGELYHVDARISPVFGKKKKILYFVGVEKDITEEKEIKKAKEEFISLASHQLRTPLASISLSAEILADCAGAKMSKEEKEYLKNIKEGVREMAQLTDSLLQISRMQMKAWVINPEPTDLGKFIDFTLKNFTMQIKNKKLRLKKGFGKPSLSVNLDRNLMKLILDNLISNAVKYTNPGGVVSIKTVRRKSDILIEVADTGCGIPRHQHGQVFNKLFRSDNMLKNKTKGSGLGLHIVKEAAASYGGKIWFESEEKMGSVFYLTVPSKGMKRNSQNRPQINR